MNNAFQLLFQSIWSSTEQIMYVSFIYKTIRTQVGRFVRGGLDVSYPKSRRFVPKVSTFRTQGLDVSYLFFFFFFDLVFSHPKLYDLFSLLNFGRFVPIFFVHFPYLIRSFLHLFIHHCVIFLVSPIANPTK